MQGVLPTFCRLDGMRFLGFLGGFGVGNGDGRSAATWCFLLLEGDVGWWDRVQVGEWDGVKRGLELWVQWVDYGCVLVVCTCSHVIRHHLMNVIYNHIRGREGWFDS
jgi:hypothetical protein